MSVVIPSYAEQVELAIQALASIGRRVIVSGRGYLVSRHGNEIRFHGQAKFEGEVPASAYVQCLRADVVLSSSPGAYPDKVLAAQCERIVAHVGGAS